MTSEALAEAYGAEERFSARTQLTNVNERPGHPLKRRLLSALPSY
jgi:hypothetical protein